MAQQTDTRRLLVLRGPSTDVAGVLDVLSAHFDVQVVDEFDDALAGIRQGRFDAVLADTGDFLPLERGVMTQRAEILFNTLGDGVCLIGPRGELAWANRRAQELPPGVLDLLRTQCATVFEQFAASAGRQADAERGRRFSLMPEGGTYYEVMCSPVRDRQGVLRQVAAVVVDATAQRRQQLKLNAIDRAGRELVRLDAARPPGDSGDDRRDAVERLKALEERTIRYSRDVLDYQHFAVLLLNPSTNRLEILVSEGFDEDAWRYELLASTEGNGICGYVAATGQSYICPEVRHDARYLKGLDGARSSLTVPLRLRDKVVGVMNVESGRAGAFGEEDRQFAEIFANHVALALHILNLLVFERRTAHNQVSDSLCAELAGPLNDIITDASELMEDYIGHDDVRKRLQSIIDLASRARRSVTRASIAPETCVLGGATAGTEPADPVLAGKRVLVADDEELIRQTVSDVLRAHGCRVDVAADGTDALRQIGGTRYDLIVSDIRMPGASGYEVFAAAKDAHPDTRVVLITAFGYDPGHSIARANREGLSAVLMKPFKANRLIEECRSALA